MMKIQRKRISIVMLSAFLYMTTTFSPLLAYAAPSENTTYEDLAEERKKLPIQSNQIKNWPEGPTVSAQSAILMEANTGTILYAKNIDEKAYPASTTKIMTCLIAAENSSLHETVSFSHDAVFSLESGSSNIGIDPGEAMPMEECYYGIMVASANEVANAVAEHVAGSMDAFADMMNQKAGDLGCKNTHFVNAHGLYDDNHYTTAYDLALIARAFFDNEFLAKVGNTASHHFEATAHQPDDFISRNKHKLITGELSYENIKGGKTGYTDEARQTLVTCAERNGMKLICVVMKEETPDQFTDTTALFDYGFTNFTIANVAENETAYQVKNIDFFHSSHDVFGNSDTLFSLNKNSFIVLPKTIDFDELSSKISYENLNDMEVAKIIYSYDNAFLGSASILLLQNNNTIQQLPTAASEQYTEFIIQSDDTASVLFINVKHIILILISVAVLISIIFGFFSWISDYKFLDVGRQKRSKMNKKAKKNRWKGPHFSSSRFKDFDF